MFIWYMSKLKNIFIKQINPDKTNLKNVRGIILKVVVGFSIIAVLFLIAVKITHEKLSQLSEKVSAILEPNIKLIKLKEISGCLYGTEANVKAYTLSRDTAYLLSYENYINYLNSQLDTLLWLSSESKIVDINQAKANQILLMQIDTLRELIISRIDLFSEYIELKTGKNSQDVLMQLLQKIQIKKTLVKNNSKQNVKIPKKSFLSRIFSSKKKNKNDISVVLPSISSDSVQKKILKIITQTQQEERIKENSELSKEIDITQRENIVMGNIFFLLKSMEEKELIEGIKRINIATEETTAKISFINNMLASFGLLLAVMFLYFIYLDIKRAKRFREQLQIAKNNAEQATQKAEESNKLKEAFLSNMSHEIRTPMNAIMGFSDLLFKKKLGEKEKEYVKIIKSAGENLLTIINDILDISKIEAGMVTFEQHPFSIKEIFKSLNVLLMEKAKEKKLELSFNYDESIPDVLLGDNIRLTQIIVNLVDNAIKFTKEGSVHVYAKVLKNENENTLMEFSINDTGIGIPKDKLEFIFERFRQAETHTTRKYGGTGLGLSIAKQLVQLQGGTLSVKSKINEGSEFSFFISYKKSLQTQVLSDVIEKKYNIENLSKIKILLVEDNQLNVLLISSLFSENNLKIQVAENGSDCIEKLKETKFDIILMDMEMPVMNGYEAASIIRNNMKNNIPIIAMTAHAMTGEKEKCLSLGMNDYISKPIDANLLFEKMYNLTYNS